MGDRFFVDTNILMYAHDKSTGRKHTRAKALIDELWLHRSGVISTQVLQELAVNLRRKLVGLLMPRPRERWWPIT